jgi:DNA-binding transcriptional regulator YhcF (GntR family)
LQTDGVLASIRGTGLVVAESAFERCCQERRELIRARLRQVLTEAKQSRLETAEILALVQKEWEALEDGEKKDNAEG